VPILQGLKEIYILMRESLKNGETLEEAVLRGLKEEFGAEGSVRKYIGSIQAMIPEDGLWEKTTLYFEVLLKAQGERSSNDAESHTDLVWMDPGILINKMKEQGSRVDREDLDESKIIEAYVKYRLPRPVSP
ncbi:MAG: NUDIX hydrolase, partial [Candidatus Paceibacterota bacterium]|jgi:ADP-ribose pyrophosphatase YjhB (NUDIX family)